jgi:hypothetical protein
MVPCQGDRQVRQETWDLCCPEPKCSQFNCLLEVKYAELQLHNPPPPPSSSITNQKDHSVKKAIGICSQYAEVCF